MAEQVTDFCRRVCTRLQCCPNLFGPTLISEKCPENCSTHTKTKYSKCPNVKWKRLERREETKTIKRRRCILRVGKERQDIFGETDADRYIRKERNIDRYEKRQRESREESCLLRQREKNKQEETNIE